MNPRERLATESAAAVAELEARGLGRRPLGSGGGIDLVTNDYLGLRRDPRVKSAVHAALDECGLGAGGARLLGGDTRHHHELEEAFAALHGETGAVLFPSGTAANVGVLGALLGPTDLAVSDAANHGSLVDGIRLAGCRKAITPHGDVEAVEAALREDRGGGRRFVIVEGVHGMDGDGAPLAALADTCRRLDALLIVDEAHSVGLLGPDGAGAVAEASCADVVAARVSPCGKALAGSGGVVTCAAPVAALLRHRARSYVLTTALPPAVAAGVKAALDVARSEPWRRQRALSLASTVRRALAAAGAEVLAGRGALVPWVLREPGRALRVAAALRERGLIVHPVRPPTVAEGTSRLRLSLHADLAAEAERHVIDSLIEVARGLDGERRA